MEIIVDDIIFENQRTKDMVDDIIEREDKFTHIDDWVLGEETIEDVEITVEKDDDYYVVTFISKEGEELYLIDDYSPLHIYEYDVKCS